MDNLDLDALSLFQRLKEESPKWAKRVFAFTVSAAAVATALILAKAHHIFDDVFPNWFWTGCHYTVASGVAAGAVAKTTVDGKKLAAKQDVAQNAQQAVDNAGISAPAVATDNPALEVKVEVPVTPTVSAMPVIEEPKPIEAAQPPPVDPSTESHSA